MILEANVLRVHPRPLWPTLIHTVGTLVAFLFLAGTASGQGAAAREPSATTAALAKGQARLAVLLKETRLDFTTSEDSSVVKFKGTNADAVSVYVKLYGDLVLVQTQTVWSQPLSANQLKQLLSLNFKNDLAKLAITEDRVIALTETELRTLDATFLKRILESVAALADDAYGALSTATSESEGYSALARSPAISQPVTLDLLRGLASLQFDGAAWRRFSNPGEPPDILQYSDRSQELFFKVISERFEVPVDKFEELAVSNLQAADANSKARVIKRGWRTVNGERMLVLEIEAFSKGIPFVFINHYYSSPSGYVQIAMWTARNLLEEKRSEIDVLVSGFRVRK